MKYFLILLFIINSSFAGINLYKVKTDKPQELEEYLLNSDIDYERHGQIFNVFAEQMDELFQFSLKSLYFEFLDFEPGYPKTDSQYFNYDQTLKQMQALQSEFKDSTELINLNERYHLAKTPEGNSLFALKFSTNLKKSGLPKIALIGQHHARELMTHHAVLDSAEYLLNQKGFQGEFEVWFIPVVNPDGLNFVFTDNKWWRKNRKKNDDDSYGVDINRNYQFHWGKCGQNSSNPQSQIFKGTKEFSEVESLSLDKLNKEFKFQYLLSFHSSGDEVLFPYVCGKMFEQEYYYGLRDRLAKHLNFGQRVASSSGEDFEHHYNKHGSYAFLLEMGKEFQPSWETYQTTVKPSALKALDFMVTELNSNLLKINIVDSEGKNLPHLPVQISNFEFIEGEIRETNQEGFFFQKLKFGKYKLFLGPQGKTKTVEVDFNRARQSFILKY